MAEPVAPVVGECHVIQLTAENFKRLTAVRIRPNEKGVTKLIGKNGAGKTSVLDAIAAALGGTKQAPEQAVKKGAKKATVVLDLGSLIVTKVWKGDKAELEVRNKEGHIFGSPQQMLDKLIGDLSFDPLAFTRAKSGDQAAMLAKAAGVDLVAWKMEYDKAFQERTGVNKQHKDLLARLRGIPEVDAPDKEVSVAALAEELEAANATVRQAESLARDKAQADAAVLTAQKERGLLLADLDAARKRMIEAQEAARAAEANAGHAEEVIGKRQAEATKADEVWKAFAVTPTEPIRAKIAEAEQVNKAVRARADRKKRVDEAYAVEQQSDALTEKLDALKADRDKSIAEAKLPIEGLALTDDGVSLNGVPFSQASGAEQLKTSVGIGLALNPRLKLCLIEDGSLLDADSMATIATMAEAAGAQVIVERVSNPGEIGIVIEDGEVKETVQQEATK